LIGGTGHVGQHVFEQAIGATDKLSLTVLVRDPTKLSDGQRSSAIVISGQCTNADGTTDFDPLEHAPDRGSDRYSFQP
jgi:uncharacterized protein YbjT (DUF2867 family)